jgi:hypothetical protein
MEDLNFKEKLLMGKEKMKLHGKCFDSLGVFFLS